MVASRCTTKFGPLGAGAEVNGVPTMVGTVRLMSRSWISELLLLLFAGTPSFTEPVMLALLRFRVVEAVLLLSAGGVTMKLIGIAPAATVRVPKSHVSTAVPAL